KSWLLRKKRRTVALKKMCRQSLGIGETIKQIEKLILRQGAPQTISSQDTARLIIVPNPMRAASPYLLRWILKEPTQQNHLRDLSTSAAGERTTSTRIRTLTKLMK